MDALSKAALTSFPSIKDAFRSSGRGDRDKDRTGYQTRRPPPRRQGGNFRKGRSWKANEADQGGSSDDAQEMNVSESEAASDDEDRSESEKSDDDDVPQELIDAGTEAEAFFTRAKKQRAEIEKARGFFKKGVSRDDRDKGTSNVKDRLPCSKCGKLGHWHKDDACPMKGQPFPKKPHGGKPSGGRRHHKKKRGKKRRGVLRRRRRNAKRKTKDSRQKTAKLPVPLEPEIEMLCARVAKRLSPDNPKGTENDLKLHLSRMFADAGSTPGASSSSQAPPDVEVSPTESFHPEILTEADLRAGERAGELQERTRMAKNDVSDRPATPTESFHNDSDDNDDHKDNVAFVTTLNGLELPHVAYADTLAPEKVLQLGT